MRAFVAGGSRTILPQPASHRIVEGHHVRASVWSAAEHLASRAWRTPDPEPVAGTEGLVDLDTRRVYSRAAERYWLLRYEEEELRFTRRDAAERWAAKLEEQGVPSELTWHDENIAPVGPSGRNVA